MAQRPQTREDLRNKIIDLAEETIRETGLSSLRARALAAQAGCALGGLYNMFADMDALILEVNGRTLGRIDAVMAAAATGTPDEQLKGLARAYLGFARDNPLLWRALFEHHPPAECDLPEWYSLKLTQLMALIAQAVAALQPWLSADEIALRARTLFAAVHGVVSISLDNRFVGISAADLDQELQRFVSLLLAGAAVVNRPPQ